MVLSWLALVVEANEERTQIGETGKVTNAAVLVAGEEEERGGEGRGRRRGEDKVRT